MSQNERCPLAIVILNYRTPGMVIDCLHTLVGQMAPQERVVVVDNLSGDDSVERITKALSDNDWGSWAELVEAGGNNGFSAGNNVGILAIDAETYFLLNSDTLVRPQALDGLREAIAKHPEISLFSPRLEWPDGKPQHSVFRDPSPWSEFDHAAATGPVSRILRRWAVAPPLVDHPVPFAWASFAAIVIRREVFEKIGLMDEGYFLYFEDIDFCRRARLAGFDSLYWPQSHVVHLRGGSGPVKDSQAKRKRLPKYYWASRSRIFAKSYGRGGLLLANLMWMMGRSISWCRELVRHKRPHLCESEGRDIWHKFSNPVEPEESWQGQFPPRV